MLVTLLALKIGFTIPLKASNAELWGFLCTHVVFFMMHNFKASTYILLHLCVAPKFVICTWMIYIHTRQNNIASAEINEPRLCRYGIGCSYPGCSWLNRMWVQYNILVNLRSETVYYYSCISLNRSEGHIDGLMWDCGISSANVLKIPQSCTQPSVFSVHDNHCIIKLIITVHQGSFCVCAQPMGDGVTL